MDALIENAIHRNMAEKAKEKDKFSRKKKVGDKYPDPDAIEEAKR